MRIRPTLSKIKFLENEIKELKDSLRKEKEERCLDSIEYILDKYNCNLEGLSDGRIKVTWNGNS